MFSQCPATPTDGAGLAQVTIDALPGDLLLEIFDLYREEWTRTRRSSLKFDWAWCWTTLGPRVSKMARYHPCITPASAPADPL